MTTSEVEVAVGRRRSRRRRCIVCEREFQSVHSDVMMCSATCRQHLRRARLGTWRMGLTRRLLMAGTRAERHQSGLRGRTRRLRGRRDVQDRGRWPTF